MDALVELLATVVAPAFIAATMVGSARQRAVRALGPEGLAAPLPAAGALAFAAAYLAVHFALFQELAAPSATREITYQHKLAWVVLGVGLAAPVAAVRAWRGLGQLVLAGVAAVLVARFGLEREFPGTAGWFVRLGAALAIYVVVVWQDRSAGRAPGALVPLAWALTLACAAVAIVLARSASEAQRLGGLAAACGAIAALGWWQRGARFPAGAILVCTLAFAGAVIQAWIYNLPFVAALLLTASLVAPGFALRRLAPGPKRTVAALAAAGVLGIAAIVYVLASAPASGPYG